MDLSLDIAGRGGFTIRCLHHQSPSPSDTFTIRSLHHQKPSPSDTYHIDEADGGLHIIRLGDDNFRGGKHLHQCLVLLQGHSWGVGHLDPDGEWAGLRVLLEHLQEEPD